MTASARSRGCGPTAARRASIGSLAAAFVTGFIASYFSSDRPYQITYVLIVATILIAESRRWMWVLPPLFLFWANCHGGFFMGFVVLGVYCAESLWQRFRGKPAARRAAPLAGDGRVRAGGVPQSQRLPHALHSGGLQTEQPDQHDLRMAKAARCGRRRF